ncbi:MAG: DUF222 domain-containing protein, partial [Nakamurella sp.]
TEYGKTVIREARLRVGELNSCSFAQITNDDFDEFGRKLELLNRELWAVLVRYADEADQRGLAATRSCSSTKVMLQQSLMISMAEAGLRVRAARATQPQDLPSGDEAPPLMPVLATAVGTGSIDPVQVSITMATMKRLPPNLPPDIRAEAENFLVRNAAIVDPDQFRTIARYLEGAIDPDGTFDDRDPSSKVEFLIGTRCTATGLTSVSGKLDDVGIATLRTAIDGLSAPRREWDGVRDDRPAPVRRAHALVEALTSAISHGDLPDQGGGRPHITVTLDWDILRERAGVAILDDGTTLSASDARRLLCDAQIIPAVLGGDGQVLDLGRTARTFNRVTRRAIVLRDRGCAFPGCSRPPAWCDAHHVEWWARDLGVTSYGNGVLLCQFHHSTIHRSDWRIVFATDGVPEFIPPRWIDPQQRPRRNTVHHLGVTA